MDSWFEAGGYCEEIYGMTMNTEENYFVCPECGEPVFEEDWIKHDEWDKCPICGFVFEEG